MGCRLIILARDGRGARSLELRRGHIALVVLLIASALAIILWLGWKLGEHL